MKKDLKEFYYNLLNIGNSEVSEQDIALIIQKIKEETNYYTSDYTGLCKVLSNNISIELNQKKIRNQIFNLAELFDAYEHEFVICCLYSEKVNYILIDLTFAQFVESKNLSLLNKLEQWPSNFLKRTEIGKKILQDLLTRGYTYIDDEILKTYLASFGINCPKLTIEKLMDWNETKKYK